MRSDPPGSPPSPGPGEWVDARVGRFQQGATALALLAGFVFHVDPVLPVWTLVLALDVVGGPRNGPISALFRLVVGNRLPPPRVRHDRARLQANALPEVVVLVLASGLMGLGVGPLGWIVALAVAAAAAYSAATDTCVGCELTRRSRRLP